MTASTSPHRSLGSSPNSALQAVAPFAPGINYAESERSQDETALNPNDPENTINTHTSYGRNDLNEKVSDSYDEKHQIYKQSNHSRRSSSSSSVATVQETQHDLEAASRVSTDAEGNTYPEGGLKAYLCVFGSFCGCVLSLGMMNTIATFEAYVTTHQLSDYPKSATGWIFGLYAFLSFFCGLIIGPVFDAKGPRWLVLSGSVLILLSYLLLGVCTAFWHFMLVFSVLGGVGTSLVFTPSIAAIGHWFLLKRGAWTGLACVGGSLGGIIYPLTLQSLLPQIGWAWSTRALALINLFFAISANLFIRSRLPPKKATKESILPDPTIFRDPIFALTTAAVFFLEWGLFIPLGYMTSYAMAYGVEEDFSYQLIAILNAGSCVGRYIPGYMADMFGRFNALIITVVICFVSVFGLWLPADGNIALIIVFAVIFGFGSGSGISLIPVCVGQLCKTEHYGRYYATCYTVVSFATLTGLPIAGAVIGATGGEYWGLIVFTGLSYLLSTAIFFTARVMKTGWKLRVKY